MRWSKNHKPLSGERCGGVPIRSTASLWLHLVCTQVHVDDHKAHGHIGNTGTAAMLTNLALLLAIAACWYVGFWVVRNDGCSPHEQTGLLKERGSSTPEKSTKTATGESETRPKRNIRGHAPRRRGL